MRTGTSVKGVRLCVGIMASIASRNTSVPALDMDCSSGNAELIENSWLSVFSPWHSSQCTRESWFSSVLVVLPFLSVDFLLSTSLLSSL